MNEIAIASVPLQNWETPTQPELSLQAGTIFRELQKPFFIEEQMKKKTVEARSAMEELLMQIQAVSFYLIDLSLYLDTHPGEAEAADLYNQHRLKRKELMAKFASEYYPLTMDCEGCQTSASIPWDVPGTAPILTIVPADKPCCCKSKGGI